MEVLDGTRSVELPRGRGRALLAVLVLRSGEVVSTDRLIHELWGQSPPPSAIKALHGLVSGLRNRLEPARASGETGDVLGTSSPGYVLAIRPEQVDANRFRRLVEDSVAAPVTRRAAQLREALGLWRGPALADFTYQPFAQTAITTLGELRLTAIDERIDADLALGRHAQLAAELEALIAEHPLRERLRAHLMLALYRSGRQAEALEVYGDIRRLLVQELGIEPGPALQSLEQGILRQDASLDLQPLPEPPEPAPGPAESVSTLVGEAWLTSERKTVTVIFVELAESIGTGGRSDPEAMRRIARRGHDVTARAVDRHGGTVEGLIGDVVVAVFGVPVAHEDDALRALRAAVELRKDLAALNEELERDLGTGLTARVGINTGEVVVGAPGTGQTVAQGDVVTVAARLQQAAVNGEVLVGEAVRRIVEDEAVLEPVDRPALAGGGHSAIAWRLIELISGVPSLAARLDTPMVGREGELGRLRMAFDLAVREQRAELITVVGDAGLGKSRLAVEFAETLGPNALVLTGHCPPYGDGITFWPLREIVLQAAGDSGFGGFSDVLAADDDRQSLVAEVASAIGLTEDPGRADGLFPAVRHLVEALARQRPLLVVLEDVHWAQPTLLDLVEYLASTTQEAVLLLCLARPELLEERRGWPRGDSAASLLLEPLGSEDTEKLVTDRLAGRMLPAEAVARVVEMAQGNPLFVEQLLAALRQDGQLSMPPSVQALLAARLDRLGPAERDLLRCAAVVGIEFSVEALITLVPDEARAYVGRHLDALEDRELIRPSRRPFLGQPALSFRHVLIQLAAYRSITRQARSELHERVADWLEAQAEATALGLDEAIGYHLEQAYAHKRDLGLVDEHSRAVALRAGERLARSGQRAFARFDGAGAENLLSRAHALLPSEHPQRWEVRRRLAEAYQVMGRHADADAVLAELLEDHRADHSGLVEHGIRLERARIRLATGPDPTSLDAVRDEAERALVVFERARDEAGMAQACFVLGLVHLRSGRPREMEEVARRGLAHAERSGHAREQLGARWWVALALVTGPTPVRDCIRLCADLVRWRGTEHPGVLADLARLRAMLGEFDQARELIARAKRLLVERTRARRPLGLVTRWSAEVEILARDLVVGERELRAALKLALDMEERDQVSQIGADLSRVLSRQGRTDEADRFAALSTDHAPAESVNAQALSRAAHAAVRLERDDHGEAERLVREAIQVVPHDMLNLRADLHVDLAAILQASGGRDVASPMANEAIGLYQRKGNLTGVLQVHTLAT